MAGRVRQLFRRLRLSRSGILERPKTFKNAFSRTGIRCILTENTMYSQAEYSVFSPRIHYSQQVDTTKSNIAATLPHICHHPIYPINRAFQSYWWQCGSKNTKTKLFLYSFCNNLSHFLGALAIRMDTIVKHLITIVCKEGVQVDYL